MLFQVCGSIQEAVNQGKDEVRRLAEDLQQSVAAAGPAFVQLAASDQEIRADLRQQMSDPCAGFLAGGES